MNFDTTHKIYHSNEEPHKINDPDLDFMGNNLCLGFIGLVVIIVIK